MQACFERQWVECWRWGCVWKIGPAQKPLCMKPWNAHMEHVIEWKTFSRWIKTVFWHSNKSMRSVQALVFCYPHCVCSTFIWLAPLSTRSASSLCQGMYNVMNVCCTVYKKYKSDLIKGGKDLFPWVRETERLAEWLAVLLLLLLLLLSLSSVAGLLPRWTSAVLLVSEFYHNHTSTDEHTASLLSAWLLNPHPDTITAIHTYINQRQTWGMSQWHADKYRNKRCSSFMHTNKNKW